MKKQIIWYYINAQVNWNYLNANIKYTLSLVPLGTITNSVGYTGRGNLTCSNINNGQPPYTFYGVVIQYV